VTRTQIAPTASSVLPLPKARRRRNGKAPFPRLVGRARQQTPIVMHGVGTRPNFVKMAPIIHELGRYPIRQLVVHSGQHYDARMSGHVLADLEFDAPDRFLGVGSGTHGEQTGHALIGFEQALMEEQPDLVVVGGDVNSTFACALAASKLGIPIAHVESGLRSGDWTMPEEINRVLTDRLSDLLFVHSPEAVKNLANEGIDPRRIHYVGNTMIDSLRRFEQDARERAIWRELSLAHGGYVLVTLHRPSNVDEPQQLAAITHALLQLSDRFPVVFPMHPRTKARLEDLGALGSGLIERVHCLEPLSYIDFLSLEAGAGAILTDSGGVQEEASALGVACYTLRANTERPVTLTLGTNTLIGDDPAAIARVELGTPGSPRPEIPLWDGQAAERTAGILAGAVRLNARVTAAVL
jgi:UDP-N-acetylglucosamine 2-epimerase (non-hydrolysing)